MKKHLKQITLVSIAASALSSCSLPNVDSLDREGKTLAATVLQSQKNRWDADKLSEKMGPAIAKKDLGEAVHTFEEVMGPLKSVGPISRNDFRMNAGILINTPDYIAEYTADLEGEKNKGKAKLIVCHQDGKWFVQNLNINSDAFGKIKEADRAGAKEFVDGFVRNYCSNWQNEELKKSASGPLQAQLRQNDIATSVFSLSMKSLGKLKKFDGAKYTNFSMNHGARIYSYYGIGEFNSGNGAISIGVVKEAGNWKIYSFNIHTQPVSGK